MEYKINIKARVRIRKHKSYILYQTHFTFMCNDDLVHTPFLHASQESNECQNGTLAKFEFQVYARVKN